MEKTRDKEVSMRVFILLAALGLMACSNMDQQNQLTGLGYSQNGSNVALIFGAPNGLEGVPTDVRELSKVMQDPKYNFHFSVTSKNEATDDQILTITKEKVQSAESLFWYFSGHGGGGDFVTEGEGLLPFRDVAEAILEVRKDKPLKRLVLFVDTCEAGDLVDGEAPVIESVYRVMKTGFEQRLFEQGFVLAASTKDQNSADLSAEQGGAFTFGLRTALADLRVKNQNATFLDLAEKTRAETIAAYSGQTPVWRAFPSEIIEKEKVFLY